MRWADLVLSYLQALLWPAIIGFVIYLFRSEFKTLILSAKRITAFGAEAEFGQLSQQLKQTERQLDFATSGGSWKTSPPTRELPDDATISRLTTVSFEDLDLANPVKAAIEATQRVGAMLDKILDYFGIPEAVRDTDSAGVVMRRITGDDRWPEVIDIIRTFQKFTANDVANAYEKVRSPAVTAAITESQLRELTNAIEKNAKETIGSMYRVAILLPELIRAEQSTPKALTSPEAGGDTALVQ